jgi:hypothetical protein
MDNLIAVPSGLNGGCVKDKIQLCTLQEKNKQP